MMALVFIAMVVGYLLGAFLSKGEKAEPYLNAAAIVGMVGIFCMGKDIGLVLFFLMLAVYVGLLFAVYYLRFFKKGMKPSCQNGFLDFLLMGAVLLAKDMLAVSLVCVAYVLVERYLFYRKFHSVF